MRALATYVDKFITNPGTPGGIAVNTAGSNDGNTPHLKAFLVQTYNADNWEITLTEKWISEGRHNLNYIQCNGEAVRCRHWTIPPSTTTMCQASSIST